MSTGDSFEDKQVQQKAPLIGDSNIASQREKLAGVLGRFLYHIWLRRQGEAKPTPEGTGSSPAC